MSLKLIWLSDTPDGGGTNSPLEKEPNRVLTTIFEACNCCCKRSVPGACGMPRSISIPTTAGSWR